MDPEVCIKRIEDLVGCSDPEDFRDAVDDYQGWRASSGWVTPELDNRLNAACDKQRRYLESLDDPE